MTKEARIFNGVMTISSIIVLGKLGRFMQKNKSDYFLIPLIPYIKINSKWVRDLKP